MTDFDAPLSRTDSLALFLPKRPGLWRAVSLAAVVAAVVIAAVSVLQARTASNVAIPEVIDLSLESAEVIVTDLPLPASAEVSVLGMPQQDSRRPFDPNGTTIDLPSGRAAVVALYDGANSIVGLAVMAPTGNRSQVELSAESTARALLTLSPGILAPFLQEALDDVEVVAQDPAFAELVAAVRADPRVEAGNSALEFAYAAIADRLPARTPLPDHGCDSVLDPRAYASAGTCVQPEAGGFRITNEQDRWALLYDETQGWTTLCIALAPAPLTGSEAFVTTDSCGGRALLVAPGPIPNQGDDQSVVRNLVRTSTAFTTLYEYAGPFADLAASSSGFTDDSVEWLQENANAIASALGGLIERNPELAAAMDVSTSASSAFDRHRAALIATRQVLLESNSTTLIAERASGDTQHIALLDFYTRAAQNMVAARTEWRWQADGLGSIDFEADS